MGLPAYKSTSNPPPDETPNSTNPNSQRLSVPGNVPTSSSVNRSRQRARRRRQRAQQRLRRAASYLLPSEFLSSSYNPSHSSRNEPQPKEHRIVLVLTPNTTSNRRKGQFNMSFATYANKFAFNIPNTVLFNLSAAQRVSPSYNSPSQPLSFPEEPAEEPGLASDNESTTSEDSILSDPEWISSNRELAMELLLGSSEDEFFDSILGTGSLEQSADSTAEADHDMGMYEDDMDLDMEDTEAEDDAVRSTNSSHSGGYALREVDEDYD